MDNNDSYLTWDKNDEIDKFEKDEEGVYDREREWWRKRRDGNLHNEIKNILISQ